MGTVHLLNRENFRSRLNPIFELEWESNRLPGFFDFLSPNLHSLAINPLNFFRVLSNVSDHEKSFFAEA